MSVTVARIFLRHQEKLLLPGHREARGRLLHPWALAQLRQWILSIQLRPQKRLRCLTGPFYNNLFFLEKINK